MSAAPARPNAKKSVGATNYDKIRVLLYKNEHFAISENLLLGVRDLKNFVQLNSINPRQETDHFYQ